jgi:hypothetical protein
LAPGLARALCGWHDRLVSVSLFEHKPQYCPFGHRLWPGMGQVGWRPCICAPALEASERGRGMGHVWVSCNACHDASRRTTFYEPPHDTGRGRGPRRAQDG